MSRITVALVDDHDGTPVEGSVAVLTAAGSRVIVVSADESADRVRRALRAGAHGYVSAASSAAELVAALTEVSQGRSYLTRALALARLDDSAVDRPALSPQELRTLRMYAGGMPMKSVALRLAISEGAVKSYIDRIREKYQKVGRDAPTKIDLYRRAVEDGYLPMVGSALS
jgi:DNA-binding NarL/FixJ family response regulator